MEEERKPHNDEHTLKFQGRAKQGARYIYSFENPENEQYPLKFTAFPAQEGETIQPPALKEDTYYAFTSYNTPNKGGTGYHHNLGRKGKGKEYLIREATEEEIAKAGAGEREASQKPQASPRQAPGKPQDAPTSQNKPPLIKEVDWDAKDRRIVRQNCNERANEIMEMCLKYGIGEKPKTREELETKINEISTNRENHVYRGKKKEEPIEALL